MILPISSLYRIRADAHNWIVQKQSGSRKNRKTGIKEPNWKDIGYFPSLKAATVWLHQYMIRAESAETLIQVLNQSAEALALISTALEHAIESRHRSVEIHTKVSDIEGGADYA